ncbi:putative Cysteine-rich venom protein [Hypsibius exemplaris]|uniref:Cysteine-rich venom protein n=1 Tax=Hypsibius exemplaris TaxID=2072580 RepID=A0A1W0X5F1_HYPEX|nr:putative Cysteine-rich venom protein [Hypsibius exemplaris]
MAVVHVITTFLVFVSVSSTNAQYYSGGIVGTTKAPAATTYAPASTTSGAVQTDAPDKGGDQESPSGGCTIPPPKTDPLPDGCSSWFDTSCQGVQQFIVDTINQVRRGVGAANMLRLSWDVKAAAQAQEFAQDCSSQIDHVTLDGCGQNFAGGGLACYGDWSGVFKSWDSEQKDFTWGESCPNDLATQIFTGHYTQDVSAVAKTIGCGFHQCGTSENSKARLVCNYCPQDVPFVGDPPCRPYLPGSNENGGVCGKCKKACDDGLCVELDVKEDKTKLEGQRQIPVFAPPIFKFLKGQRKHPHRAH